MDVAREITKAMESRGMSYEKLLSDTFTTQDELNKILTRRGKFTLGKLDLICLHLGLNIPKSKLKAWQELASKREVPKPKVVINRKPVKRESRWW